MNDLVKYQFVVEWTDPHAQLVRQYTLSYYKQDNSFEMFDIKNNKLFLKRTQCDGVGLKQLKLANTVLLFSRLLFVKEYANQETRDALEAPHETALIICSASVFPWCGLILNYLVENDYTVSKLRTFIIENQGPKLKVGKSLVIKVNRQSVLKHLNALCSFENNDSIYKILGIPNDPEYQIFHSKSEQEALEDDERLFGNPSNHPRTAMLQKSTLCLIKPHAIANGDYGLIIDCILKGGYEITDMEMMRMTKMDTEEFYEVYKGVLQSHQMTIQHMSSAPLIAMEVINGKSSIVGDFRQFVGQADPQNARIVNEKSIRSVFGEDLIKNAVHCTDLQDDAILEVEYFFSILLNNKE